MASAWEERVTGPVWGLKRKVPGPIPAITCHTVPSLDEIEAAERGGATLVRSVASVPSPTGMAIIIWPTLQLPTSGGHETTKVRLA